MAYPRHYLLAWGGPLGSQEQWSCSLRMTHEGLQNVADATLEAGAKTSINEVAAKVRAYHQGSGSLLNNGAQLGWVKFNPIGPNGRYINLTTYEKLYEPAVAPQSGSAGPFQIAAAISLETGVNRGLAVAGRWFLPVANIPVADGLMVQNVQDELRNDAARFVRALNNWEGIDMPSSPVVCVVSRGKRLNPTQTPAEFGPGTFRPVTSIAVGNVLDTQRRRRAQLKEAYRTWPIADEPPA